MKVKACVLSFVWLDKGWEEKHFLPLVWLEKNMRKRNAKVR